MEEGVFPVLFLSAKEPWLFLFKRETESKRVLRMQSNLIWMLNTLCKFLGM